MGCVYILKNPAMPDLIKIGHTTRTVSERAAEFYTTGVPEKFEVVCSVDCEDYQKVESQMHERLAKYRMNENREFFNCSPEMAIELLEKLRDRNWRKWTSHYLTRFKKMLNFRSKSSTLK